MINITIENYTQYAIKTRLTTTQTDHISNGMIGLVDETREILQALNKVIYAGDVFKGDLVLELGDGFWYLACLWYAITDGQEFSILFTPPDEIRTYDLGYTYDLLDFRDDLYGAAARACGPVKKLTWHKLNHVQRKNHMMSLEIELRTIVYSFGVILDDIDIPIEHVLQRNIEKLAERYPELADET